jgi:hypothetical protein
MGHLLLAHSKIFWPTQNKTKTVRPDGTRLARSLGRVLVVLVLHHEEELVELDLAWREREMMTREGNTTN